MSLQILFGCVVRGVRVYVQMPPLKCKCALLPNVLVHTLSVAVATLINKSSMIIPVTPFTSPLAESVLKIAVPNSISVFDNLFATEICRTDSSIKAAR